MEKQILDLLKITPEQLQLFNDKRQKIRDQTAARNKIYKIRNAEKLEKIRAEKAQQRQQLKQQQLKQQLTEPEIKNEVVKITRKYTKKAPIIKDVNYIERRGRKRKNPKIETDKSIKKKSGPKIKDVNIIDLVNFLK
tara:strand:- start:699 stop:1109 length:411 start_codon:yes stop_codon:yes gene_type:complete